MITEKEDEKIAGSLQKQCFLQPLDFASNSKEWSFGFVFRSDDNDCHYYEVSHFLLITAKHKGIYFTALINPKENENTINLSWLISYTS